MRSGVASEEALKFARIQIVQGIPALVAVMTPAGEVELVNDLVLEYFGKTPEELKDWTTADAVHPDDLPNAIATCACPTASARSARCRWTCPLLHRRA